MVQEPLRPEIDEQEERRDYKCSNADNDFPFFIQFQEERRNEKGQIYTWGSGEMGQLGYAIKIISKMPKDREGYPY